MSEGSYVHPSPEAARGPTGMGACVSPSDSTECARGLCAPLLPWENVATIASECHWSREEAGSAPGGPGLRGPSEEVTVRVDRGGEPAFHRRS